MPAFCTGGGDDGNGEGGVDCSTTPLPLPPPSAGFAVTPTLPQHTFVFARPVSQARAVGDLGSLGTRGLCVGNTGAPLTRKEQQESFTEQQRPGIALAYHSSAFGGGPASGNWSQPRHAQPLDSASQAPKDKDSAENKPSEHKPEGNRGVPTAEARPAKRDSACERRMTSSEVSVVLPTRLGYSLGTPFHGQRVASARFILGDAAIKTPGDGLENLRLVTGKPTPET